MQGWLAAADRRWPDAAARSGDPTRLSAHVTSQSAELGPLHPDSRLPGDVVVGSVATGSDTLVLTNGGTNGGTPVADDAVAPESVFKKLEASAGLEPAVEVLQVGLYGPLRSAEFRSLLRIDSRCPPSSATNRPGSRALPSPLPSSPVVSA